MKIALAQISPYLCNVNKNFDLHLQFVDKAAGQGADLLVFPELSLTGYTLMDLVEETSLDPENDPIFSELKSLSHKVPFILGFVEEKKEEKGLFYNSAAFLAGGKILHIHRKVFLPTFGMFEEARFFASGKNFHSFDSSFGKMGMLICRDFLHYSSSYVLFAGGAEIIIAISAAPGRDVSGQAGFGTSRMWELMGEAISRFSNAFVIYCNRVGFEDGKTFAGGSFIFNPSGVLLAKAAYFERDFILQDIDLDDIRKARKNYNFKRDDKPEIILQALRRVVSHYED